MPYGVECDQYSVLGVRLRNFVLATNDVTGEKVYILTILCNELSLMYVSMKRYLRRTSGGTPFQRRHLVTGVY